MFDLFKELYAEDLLSDYLSESQIEQKERNDIKNIIKTDDLDAYIDWYNKNTGFLVEMSPNKDKHGKIPEKIPEKINDILTFINSKDEKYSHINRIIYWNHFMPIDIQIMVQNRNILLHKWTYKKITLYYYCFEDECDQDKILNIMHICHFYSTYMNYKDTITINILRSNFNKIITDDDLIEGKERILTSKHINSGSCLIDVYINLWRDEEICKVLLHELTHNFKIDSYTHNLADNQLNKQISKTFKNNHYYKSAEAYTESIAIILHCIYVIYKLNINNKLNVNNKLKSNLQSSHFRDIFAYEYNFTLYQVAKLMKYYKVNEFNKIIPSELNKYTAVFSYYFIKVLIMHNFTMFLEFVTESLYFNDRVDEMIVIINKSLHDKTFHDNIKYYYDIVDLNKNKFINRTLRMSCVEIK